MRPGRRQPYTVAGIRRLRCVRCRRRAVHQWKACADGLWRPICLRCDVALNRLAMTFMRDPDVDLKVRRYAERKAA